MSDEGQIKSIIERVQRLQEEKRTIEDDIKEVYAEARSNGYDVKVLRAVVKHLGKDQDEVAEFDAIFDLYLQSFLAAGIASRAHVARDAGARARGGIETAGSTARLSGNAALPGPVAPTQETGHVDRSAGAQPDSAEGRPAIPSMPGDAGTGQGSQTDTTGQPSGAGTGSAVRAGAPVSKTATPVSFPAAQSEAAAGKEEGVRAPVDPSPAAEQPKFARKEHALRPHCQRPETCGSYGSKHCADCERAAKTADEDADDTLVPAFLRKNSSQGVGEQA